MRTVLIKCGGSTLDELTQEFFSSLHELKKQHYQIIIIHGGGPDINRMLTKLNVEAEYVNGLRKTSEVALHVVEMVLSGQTNRKLVQQLTCNGLKALGVNGSDAELLKGDFVDKETLGFVGDITNVNVGMLEFLLKEDIIPVLTPIATNGNGSKLNVNADYAAAAVAHALKADQCLFVTDVDGLLINGVVQETVGVHEIERYIESGEIYGGMIPKVVSAMSALQKGVESVRIVSGSKAFFQHNRWMGTVITGEELVIK